jgi:5-methylcytosine-specific restriction endonuclease McrA
MFAINKPDLEIDSVFEACANSIQNPLNRKRILGIKSYIRGSQIVYNSYARYSLLYKIRDESVSHPACDASKVELVNLYVQQLVNNKEGRKKYDILLSLAPNGICPFCGFAQASTLDHYMPKKKYPSFSISPLNLVPSCGDCNTRKNEDVAENKHEQIIHPYYDHELFDDQWLFASVNNTTPASLTFYTSPPTHWKKINRERVESHFKNFELAQRFSVQVATEISTLKHELEYDFDISQGAGVIQELSRRHSAYSKVYNNWWKTAMYQALASNDWYCNGGFK